LGHFQIQLAFAVYPDAAKSADDLVRLYGAVQRKQLKDKRSNCDKDKITINDKEE